MKKIIYILTILFPLVLISCASTPIKDVKVPDLYKIDLPQEEQVPVQMDFIGYKSNINLLSVAMGNTTKDSFLMDLFGDSEKENTLYISDYEYWRDIRDSSSLKNFQDRLVQNNIATDQTELYFGDFTPQDLAVYKGQNRYVTFVDVMETKMIYLDKGNFQKSWATTGAVMLVSGAAAVLSMADTRYNLKNYSSEDLVTFSLGIGGIVVGTGAFIPSFSKPMTTFNFHGKYAICVYDTLEKKLIKRQIIDIDQEDTFTGSFESDKTNKNDIYRYYGQCVANRFLREYQNISYNLAFN